MSDHINDAFRVREMKEVKNSLLEALGGMLISDMPSDLAERCKALAIDTKKFIEAFDNAKK